MRAVKSMSALKTAATGFTNVTTFSFEEVSAPVPVLIRVSGNAPAAPPPESTLPPPILLSSAVIPSVAQSGSDLLPAPGCVVAERVVGFGGPAGGMPMPMGKQRHRIILSGCVFFFFFVGVRARCDV